MASDTRKKASLWLKIVAIVLSVLIVITGGLMIGWHAIFGSITDDGGYQASQGQDINNADNIVVPTMAPDETHEPEDPDITSNPDETNAPTIKPSSLSSLQSNIKNWMNNGTPVKDKDVINILLIGMDNSVNGKPQPISVNGRADAMCIVSINKRTKTITLASLLRDQYSYVVTKNKARFTKFHHALSYAGPAKQVEMVESYYKIVIDNYVILSLDSLPKVIDALGGVEINITKNEATYLNSIGWSVNPKGEKRQVNGKDALAYMRIRKGTSGGDTARVGRQQQVITTIIGKMKSSSASQMVELTKSILPYVRTGLTSDKIFSLVATAVTEGWFKYDIKRLTLPDSSCSKTFVNSADGGWYWKVDYPLAAQKLQLALYGKSNIVLEANRKKWI